VLSQLAHKYNKLFSLKTVSENISEMDGE